MEELTDYEKLIESVNQLAALISEYHIALINKGFTKKEALQITIEYQKEILAMAKPVRKE